MIVAYTKESEVQIKNWLDHLNDVKKFFIIRNVSYSIFVVRAETTPSLKCFQPTGPVGTLPQSKTIFSDLLSYFVIFILFGQSAGN